MKILPQAFVSKSTSLETNVQQEKENDIHTVVKLLTQKRMYNIANNLLSERTKTQTEQTRESVSAAL